MSSDVGCVGEYSFLGDCFLDGNMGWRVGQKGEINVTAYNYDPHKKIVFIFRLEFSCSNQHRLYKP